MSYAIHSTPTNIVDHEALSQLVAQCSDPGVRAVLVGFGETAKHVINLCRDNVVAVYDPNPIFRGVHFRGIPVVDLDRKFDANLILSCEYRHNYGYLGDVVRLYGYMRWFYPSRLLYKQTSEINVFEQETLYHEVFRNEDEAPASMMAKEKIHFTMELLRLGLTFPGDVIEFGTWQGGSAWYFARALNYLKEFRKFHLVDLFETHQPDPTATMCTDEIRARITREYANTELYVGLVWDSAIHERIGSQQFCFAHVDLGYEEVGLDYLWQRLAPGAPMVLDNYGHLAAPTWRWDDFFAARGTRVTRLPWSEQGLVFKRPADAQAGERHESDGRSPGWADRARALLGKG
ncbi:class I SAM-dependent methyltransferase [Methylobacterium oryzisoli]|uniref:class I SAM-dependent methyltransferase n=1 Tax=Methylobacterium oryzisoli TaxID=3385502 RepID=UPI00389289B5